MMHVRQRNHIPLWQFESLGAETRVHHFISTRWGGVSAPPYDALNLGFQVGDRTEAVLENRQSLARALGINLEDFVTCHQAHGNVVRVVASADRGAGAVEAATAIPDTDALITDQPGLMLMLLQADCVPVFLFDRKKRLAGLAHAGWRGTVARVTAHAIESMMGQFGSSPEDLLAAIGPSIGPCCYEVGEDVIEAARASLPNPDRVLLAHPRAGKAYFDLWTANWAQLRQCGVPAGRIEIAEVCTRCQADIYFSDRSQRPTGRFGAGIMLTVRSFASATLGVNRED